MDWNQIMSLVMNGVVSAGVVVGTGLLARYTGIQVSAQTQEDIKATATRIGNQIVAAAAPGIENAVIHVTDPIVTNAVPKMVNDLKDKGITITPLAAADHIQAALGAAQVASGATTPPATPDTAARSLYSAKG